jgi:hypothetical protein
MRTTGRLSPSGSESARAAYEELGSTAQVVVREVARAMEFDREEYDELVTGETVETARDALFASLLEVQVGSDEEYESWAETFDGPVTVAGSDSVDQVVWHAFDGEAVAATFQHEEQAAVSTLRRQAFGRLYRPLFYEDEGDDEPLTNRND